MFDMMDARRDNTQHSPIRQKSVSVYPLGMEPVSVAVVLRVGPSSPIVWFNQSPQAPRTTESSHTIVLLPFTAYE